MQLEHSWPEVESSQATQLSFQMNPLHKLDKKQTQNSAMGRHLEELHPSHIPEGVSNISWLKGSM